MSGKGPGLLHAHLPAAYNLVGPKLLEPPTTGWHTYVVPPRLRAAVRRGQTDANEVLRKTLQQANHLLGRTAGFAFARYPTRLNAELCRILEGFAINHVLDIGAHDGGFGRRLRKYTAFEGQITSFEPTPASFAALVELARADGRWRVLKMALGSVEGTVALNIYPGDGQMNSIRSLGPAVAEYAPGLAPTGPAISVDLKRLDRVWPELGQDPSRTFLKTDTQGYDLEVIRGAGSLMESIPAVLMEVAVQPLYEGAPTLRAVVAEMDDRGFEMTSAFPVHRYARGLRVIEFDCTFVSQRCF